MKRIIDISELKPGDIIWRIKNDIDVEAIEFLCIHPHNDAYSLFIDMNKDGMPKFYNKRLQDSKYYLYDKDSEKDIAKERIRIAEKRLYNLKRDLNAKYKK